MSRVKIENGQLVITMQGARKFFALKSELSIPLENVVGVTDDPIAWKDTPKVFEKRAGTNADMFYFGGTFVQDGNRMFYDLRRKEDAVTIELKDENFCYLVIGVDDPKTTVEFIEQALSK